MYSENTSEGLEFVKIRSPLQTRIYLIKRISLKNNKKIKRRRKKSRSNQKKKKRKRISMRKKKMMNLKKSLNKIHLTYCLHQSLVSMIGKESSLLPKTKKKNLNGSGKILMIKGGPAGKYCMRRRKVKEHSS